MRIRDKNSAGDIFDATILLTSGASMVGEEYIYSIQTLPSVDGFESGMTAIRTNGAKILIAATDDTHGVPYIGFYDEDNNEVVRIGNLHGAQAGSGYGLYGENVHLTGYLKADEGFIGAITINSDGSIQSANQKFKVSAAGNIEATGGTIGG